MTPEEIAQMARESMQAALTEERNRLEAEAKAAADKAAEIESAVKAAVATAQREWLKSSNRLSDRRPANPQNQAPVQAVYADTRRFDHLDVNDLSFLVGVTEQAHRDGKSSTGASESAFKALAIRIAEDKGPQGDEARRDMKAIANIDPADVVNAAKANELDYSTQAGYGDEWVGVEYSRRLWERIRFNAPVTSKIPFIEVPQSAESVYVPLEAADPAWYRVAQTTGTNATTGIPDSTITGSKLATDRKLLTVDKMGARVSFAEEMNEDSLIPWISQLRAQLERSGSENLDAVVIDGDTDTSATTNINHIAGTPGGTENYIVLNGLRKLALVTNTANSRSASGALVDTDFLETLKLMGVAGLNAADRARVTFLVDANLNWKIMQITSVKTRDVFTNATIENGMLTGIWGYPVLAAPFMHAAYGIATSPRKVNTAGKVDQSSSGANNTTGAILAVRWDQWLFGYKRRLTLKIQDIPNADSQQIVATMRVGLAYRDTEASAISYNVAI